MTIAQLAAVAYLTLVAALARVSSYLRAMKQASVKEAVFSLTVYIVFDAILIASLYAVGVWG
jgi:hypothetical protein